ncbi:hypothetical protein ACGFZL_18720 [Streptomyces sp. NPDC048182]|uniref:hypothetical protein n=1 Tax=unclassified Streptomyces TaxID=2593676 RepID=UPI0033AD4D88
MFRRRESVPFAFVAEADAFRSNVAPPPRQKGSRGERAGRWLFGLTVTAGLAGALLIGLPAMSADHPGSHKDPSQASRTSDGH